MIKIDQDILCDFCKDHNNSRMDNCEGSQCEEMAELYLDENGISDPSQGKRTFEKLNINNVLYFLDYKPIVPKIVNLRITEIRRQDSGSLQISTKKEYINISQNKEDKSSSLGYFLYKTDAQKKLEELCLERILALSKAIGSNQGEEKEITK